MCDVSVTDEKKKTKGINKQALCVLAHPSCSCSCRLDSASVIFCSVIRSAAVYSTMILYFVYSYIQWYTLMIGRKIIAGAPHMLVMHWRFQLHRPRHVDASPSRASIQYHIDFVSVRKIHPARDPSPTLLAPPNRKLGDWIDSFVPSSPSYLNLVCSTFFNGKSGVLPCLFVTSPLLLHG